MYICIYAYVYVYVYAVDSLILFSWIFKILHLKINKNISKCCK